MRIIYLLISATLSNHLLMAQSFDFSSLEKRSVTDYDGNIYPTVKIGSYWWMAENLRTTHYNDGTRISYLGTGGIADYNNAKQGYAYPDLDSANIQTYGLLYTWYVATNTDNKGICPAGWTLSDTTQWFEMARALGGKVLYEKTTNGWETVHEGYGATCVGQYLKSDNGILWKSCPSISTNCNQTGMNIVPAGYIQYQTSNYFGKVGNFWTSNYVHADSSGQGRRTIWFSYDTHEMSSARYHHANPTSVRCMKRHDDSSLPLGYASPCTSPDPVSAYTSGNVIYVQAVPGAKICIYSLTGCLVAEDLQSSTLASYTIDHTGLYIVKITYANSVKIVKCIIKQNT